VTGVWQKNRVWETKQHLRKRKTPGGGSRSSTLGKGRVTSRGSGQETEGHGPRPKKIERDERNIKVQRGIDENDGNPKRPLVIAFGEQLDTAGPPPAGSSAPGGELGEDTLLCGPEGPPGLRAL